MIQGIGTDIIEISRIQKAVAHYGDRFLSRLYTDHEINYCKRKSKLRIPELAVRFAAKEAYVKAKGTGFVRGIFWKDIEIKNDKLGKPEYFIRGEKDIRAHVSLSHSDNFAVAYAIIEKA